MALSSLSSEGILKATVTQTSYLASKRNKG